ncbi:MAG: quinoprotein dehydrogenase-associated SoxYZ-like carrier [Pseudolabrys sp.]
MIGKTARMVCIAGMAAAMLGIGTVAGLAAGQGTDDPWPGLAREVFKNRPLADGAGLFTLTMPYRAADAAVVPLEVRTTLPAGDERRMTGLTIVIDNNPSPVAARFTFGRKAHVTGLATRVRVNSYTEVHAVAEFSDGKLYMVKRFVKASGGCSAPALKVADEATIHLGQMKFRQFTPHPKAKMSREAQIMIRHPNNSGLQMNQVTRLYIPAFFVNDLKIWQGKELLLAMKGGISISENPSIRFDFKPNGSAPYRVEAVDTKKDVFKGEWPAASSGM